MRSTTLARALILLLLLALLGEGGAAPGSSLVWHGALVLLVLAVWLGPTAAPRGPSMPRPAVAAFGLFAVVVGVEGFFAPYRFAAWLSFVAVVATGAVLFLAARAGPAFAAQVGWPLRVAAVVEVGLAVWQRFHGDPRPAGTFLNENHLGAWLGALLLHALAETFGDTEDSRRLQGLRFGAMAILALGLWLTGSRGALLGVAAGVVVLTLLAWRRLVPARRRELGIATVVLALVVAGVLATRLADADPYRHHRLRIWKAGLTMIVAAPLAGSGPGQLAIAARNFQFPDGVEPLRYDRSFDTLHSDLLGLVAEFGVGGALAFGLSLVVAGREVMRRRRRGELPASAEGILAALVGLAVQAGVDDLSERPAVYLLAAALGGALLAAPTERPARPGLGTRLTVAVLLVLGYVVCDVGTYVAWRDLRPLPPQGRLDADGTRRLERALRMNPFHPAGFERLALHHAGEPAAWGLEDYAAAREAAERAGRLSPRDPRTALALARVEALACRTLFFDVATRERARAAYERAASLARTDPTIVFELGGFLMDTDDPDGARRAAERALGLEPESVAPRLLLADALMASGGAAEAPRAGALLAEARERAARWSAERDSTPYNAVMLGLDPRVLARVAARVAAPG